MRTIKTALAVSICIIISNLFNVTSAFYAVIAAIISMGNTVSYSYKNGLNRIKGTVLGALVGLLFSLIKPGDVILAGMGIVIIIYLCNVFKWNTAITIACTVFCVILTNLNGRNPLQYSVFRTLDTLLGIVVSIVVNYTIFPPKIHENIHKSYLELRNNIFELCKEGILNPENMDLKLLKKYIDNLEKSIKQHDEEFESAKKSVELLEDYRNFLEECKKIFIYFEVISTMTEEFQLNGENRERLKEVFSYVEDDKDSIEIQGTENIVYNYNVSKIMDGLTRVKKSPILT